MMILDHIDRPLTGWSDRYVKAHISLLSKDEVDQWAVVIDEFGALLKAYINTPVFISAPVSQKQHLLNEFCELWNLPYGEGLIQLLHQYQHLHDFNIFVDAWKAFYYKTRGVYHLHIITPVLLHTKDVDKILQAFALASDKCHVTQKIDTKLIGGLIVECNGVRFDTSIQQQLKSIQRNLSV